MNDKEKWYELMEDYCNAHVFEVGTETTEKWMSILFEKRYINFLRSTMTKLMLFRAE